MFFYKASLQKSQTVIPVLALSLSCATWNGCMQQWQNLQMTPLQISTTFNWWICSELHFPFLFIAITPKMPMKVQLLLLTFTQLHAFLLHWRSIISKVPDNSSCTCLDSLGAGRQIGLFQFALTHRVSRRIQLLLLSLAFTPATTL
jgi:hypothetical protein